MKLFLAAFQKLKEARYEISSLMALTFVCFWFFRLSLRENVSFGVYQDNEFMISPIMHSLATNNNGLILNTFLPEFLGGLDLQSFAQFSGFYPLYFAGTALFETPLSSIQALNYLIHLHLSVFAIGSYILLKSIAVDRLAAIAGVILIVFNANNLNYASWVNITAAYAWLPWIITFQIKALELNRYRYWFFFFLSSGMMFMASPSQPVIHAFFMVIILMCSRFFRIRKNPVERLNFVKSMRKSVYLLPVFLAFISPVLIPLVVNASAQIRWIGNFPAILGLSEIPYDAFLTAQVEKKEILNLILPPSNPREIGSIYFGFLVFVLLLLGLKRLRKNFYWKLFFVIGIYSLLSSFGSNFGFAQINYRIPLLSAIREPSRFLVLAHFCFGICSALAADDAIKRFKKYQFIKIPGLSNFINLPLARNGFAVAIVVMILPIQAWGTKWSAPQISSSNFITERWSTLDAPLMKISQLDPRKDYRVIFGGEIDPQRASMYSAFYGLRTLNTYINPLPYEQFNAMYFYNNYNYNYKNMLGVRYLVCTLECPIIGTKEYLNFKNIWADSKFRILENDKAQSFAYLPKKVIVSSSTNESLDILKLGSQVNSVIDAESSNPTELNADCVFLNMKNQKFTKITASIRCNSEGYLILSSYNDGNWGASLNNTTQKIETANGYLVGLKLFKGINNVHLEHESKLKLASYKFSVVVLAMVVLILMVQKKSSLFLNKTTKRKTRQNSKYQFD